MVILHRGHTISIFSDADVTSSVDQNDLSSSALDLESGGIPKITVQNDESDNQEEKIDEKIAAIDGAEFA